MKEKQKFSQAGVNFLLHAESFSPTAYDDANGKSIGFGHFIRPHEKHLLTATITREQAMELFRTDLAPIEGTIRKLVKVLLAQHEYDALVIFTYNIGVAGLETSTTLRMLNAGNWEMAADAMLLWIKSFNKKTGKKEPNPALKARRARERSIFLGKGDPSYAA